MPTEEQIIDNYIRDMQLESLGYFMFILNTYDNIDDIKEIVQQRIDKLSKDSI